MTVGVQQMKTKRKTGFTKYRRPVLWQKLAQARRRREILKQILKKIGKYSHMSSSKANLELYPVLKILLQNLEIEKAAKIAAFYDLNQDELEFLVGERAIEIHDFIREHALHRVEDETFLSGFSKAEESVEKRLERREEKKKKGKDLTLDNFFS